MHYVATRETFYPGAEEYNWRKVSKPTFHHAAASDGVPINVLGIVNKNPRRAATLCRDYDNHAKREA